MRSGSGSARADGASPPAERPDVLFRELGEIRRRDPECADLLQFRRLTTARQYRHLYRLLREHVRPGARVLDWGCGNGHVSYALTRLGYRATGFSFEDFGLRRHLGAEYRFRLGHPAEPSRLPFEAGEFDAVLSVGVLEHVRETGGDESASLREIARVLRGGGVFLCYHLPNRYSAIEAITRRIPSKHSHPFRYTRRQIGELCRGAGLELVESRRYGVLPRNFWHRLPAALGDSPWIAGAWDLIDQLAGRPLSPVSQNYLFVARKPAGAGGGANPKGEQPG